ncbi:hypothetical protein [Methylocystis bryophila]|uniref:Uncharacterized protein n=1 Tax=Methylocystis bryophila TaxID=655015 RepID=A0A1W6MQF4_9HYPH|nr:hypothetical protein [Methylocystis bryophila]ARN79792.1 hypothetical protein B1812_00490 [Methylocystis bryophila]BDV39674.1 hypothetical protein DSM21852_29270 [Methylocystis bryophila]
MDRLRWIVVLIISGALLGGVLGRLRYASSDLAETQFEIGRPSESGPMRISGEFTDPLNYLTGYEFILPRCPQPLAVLPVSTRTLAIPPSEYQYPQSGEYAVSYVYNGGVYAEEGIAARLRLLRMLYRFESLFGLTDARGYAFFLKLWIPANCAGVSTAEAESFQRSLITRVGSKPR